MSEHDRDARRSETRQIDEDQQRYSDNDAGNQDREAGKGGNNTRNAIAGGDLHVPDGDTNRRREERCRQSDDQARFESPVQILIAEEAPVPFEREAAQRGMPPGSSC